MTDFLLELLSEEIPARMQDRARDDLARLFADEIGRAGLGADAIQTFATPRRLALIARGLPALTAASSEEIKGPRASAPPQALDGFLRKTGLAAEQLVERDGVLFARIERAGRRTAEVLAEAIPAIVRAFPWPKAMRWGAASADPASLRWVRPLHGIVALFGDEVVACEVDGIVAGATTLGHRFHHPGPITIGGADDYGAKLEACHVIVDQARRRAIIGERGAALAAAAGLSVIADEALVAENAGLTEWPVPLLGGFDPAFLDVPREVIQLTMRTNQKYFALVDAAGRLAPNFLCTANIDARDGGAAIVDGNRKVLAARLADARFFWEQDRKAPLAEQAAKLDRIVFHEKLGTVADKVARVAKLARWLVEEGIISSPARGGGPAKPVEGGRPRAERPSASPLHPPPAADGPPPPAGEELSLADMAEQAALLCKADLVSGMVGEFPELQGVMGGYYARAEGYPDAIADAIRDHYKPVGQGDEVPTAPVTVAVSLADKLDTLIEFFSVGEAPTGSRDPFALRRATLAIANLIIVNSIRLSLIRFFGKAHEVRIWRALAGVRTDDVPSLDIARPDLIDVSIENGVVIVRRDGMELFRYEVKSGETLDRYRQVVDRTTPTLDLLDFFAERLKVQQREAGVRHDLIDAVFALGGEDDLVRLLARVKALQGFVGGEDGVNLLAGYKRAANILKKEGWDTPSPQRGEGRGEGERGGAERPTSEAGHPHPTLSLKGEGFDVEPAEVALVAALDEAEPRAEAAIAAEDFEGAMAALATLRAPIDAFFEAVTVNDPDAAVRARRLALLARVRDAMHRVADFSKIEG